MKNIARFFLIVSINICFAIGVLAATFTVNTTSDTADVSVGDNICSDGSTCSLRAAISEANALPGADTIMLPAGIYMQTLPTVSNEDINAGGDWDITGDLTIIGAGQDVTILQAAATPDTATEGVIESPLVSDPPTVIISGVTIRHGKKTGTANSQKGGGIRNYGGDMTIIDSTITLNRGVTGGGIYNRGNITLNNVIVSNNTCDQGNTSCYGGGMYSGLSFSGPKTITITGSTFTGNKAVGAGNVAAVYGVGFGAECTDGNPMTLNISNSSFTDNHGFTKSTDPEFGGGGGAGIWVLTAAPSVFNITNTVVSGNGINGGGAISGSGIRVGTTAKLTGTWDGVTVTNNSGNFFGSGIVIAASAGVSALNIINSTVSGNTGTAKGGGATIMTTNNSGATLTVNFVNSTIADNTGSYGGGVYVLGGSPGSILKANFDSCTIDGNSVTANGGGLHHSAAPQSAVNIKNSIVAGNSAGTAPDISGPIVSQNFNHIGDLTGATFSPLANDSHGFDPQLGALQNNGGATLTQLLAATSPLVNVIPVGVNGCGTTVLTDQRGLPRPAMTRCEPGATEVQSFAGGPFSVSGTITTDTGIPIRNIVVVLSGGGLAQPIFTQTGSLGNFQFANVPANAYTVSISSKRFLFSEDGKFVNVAGDRTDVNFSGTPRTDSRMIMKSR
jgi:CSLREA domain-containing protein